MTGSDRVEVVDGLVRRPAQTWTPTVHRLLVHLGGRLPGSVPRPVAVDGSVEVVSFLPGAAGADCWPAQATDVGLASFARLLRRVHDASRDHVPGPEAEWATPTVEPAEVVCHGDPGPWNVVWRGGEAVGLLDWDLAHLGPVLDDVAYALEQLAPFRSDAEALRWRGFTARPDRPHRIRVFLAAYGWTGTEDLVDAVVARQRATVDRVRHLAGRGVEPQVTWVRDGHLEELAERVRWSETHRHLLSP
ncbi:phosphotransferase [Kineococcus sp. DHX-1]|uniref:phosphotransferase n=1 Tax=Kineococcus sp. DHX-1 TaxID=3349638 RepID=UPI0036D42345